MSDDKGIYLSVSTHLNGEAYDLFLKAIEAEAKAWVASESGRSEIKRAVAETIRTEVTRRFGWGFDKDERSERFKAIVTDAMFSVLFQTVGATPEPSKACGENLCGRADCPDCRGTAPSESKAEV